MIGKKRVCWRRPGHGGRRRVGFDFHLTRLVWRRWLNNTSPLFFCCSAYSKPKGKARVSLLSEKACAAQKTQRGDYELQARNYREQLMVNRENMGGKWRGLD